MFVIRVLFTLVFLYFLDSVESNNLDDVDIDSVLRNTKLMKFYIRCMLDTGPCTAEGHDLRREFKEVLLTGCAKCEPRTIERIKKTYQTIKSDPRFSGDYDKLLDKYDPGKKYRENLERLLENTPE